jgi:predicted O-methyltransferase YrrM
MQLNIDVEDVKGFLADDEAKALYEIALKQTLSGPCLEIGSYCGKSTIYLAAACKKNNSLVYAVDHHRGSEEHQLGEEYHDPDLYSQQDQLMDSFTEFRRNIRKAELEDVVVPLVTNSELASKYWSIPLSMVFIDGGHSIEAAMMDYRSWAPHVKKDGILAIHDIFPDPNDGGQAPYDIYKLALASGLFEALPTVNTLGLLKRL